jgi:hypothetical protein
MARKFIDQRQFKESDTDTGGNREATREPGRRWLRRDASSSGSAMRLRFLFCVFVMIVALLLTWYFKSSKHRSETTTSTATSTKQASGDAPPRSETSNDLAPTAVYAHNLLLRKGPDFRIYVRWLSGHLVRTRRDVNPSFDDPDSFLLDIKSGVVRANIGDIANFLNASMVNSPVKNIVLSGNGNQIRLEGTLRKGISLPIELTGTISALSDNRIQMHITKLNVLKVPVKGLLGGFHIDVSDLMHAQDTPGVQVSGNDIFFDTQALLPPPHIRGQLTSVSVVNPDLEEVFGNAEASLTHVEQWRNFLRLSGGSLDFGRLTMHPVDLIMIDISNDVWFDLDLAHYQEQLVNGYTRMTPKAGLQIFMPDLDSLPHNKANRNISMEWLKNRNLPPPPEVSK